MIQKILIESVLKDAYVYVLDRVDATSPISKLGSTTVSAESRAKDYYDGEWRVHSVKPVPALLRFPIERIAQEILIDEGLWLDPKLTGGSASEIFLCAPERAEQAVSESFELVSNRLLEKLGTSDALQRLRDELEQAVTSQEEIRLEGARRGLDREKQISSLSERLTAEQRKAEGKQLLTREVESLNAELENLKRESRKKEQENSALRSLLAEKGLILDPKEIRSYRAFYKNAPTKKKLDVYMQHYDRMVEILEGLVSS